MRFRKIFGKLKTNRKPLEIDIAQVQRKIII